MKNPLLRLVLLVSGIVLVLGFTWHGLKCHRLEQALAGAYADQSISDTQVSASVNPVTDVVTVRLAIVPDLQNPFSDLGIALAEAAAPSLMKPQLEGLLASDKELARDPYATIVPYTIRLIATTAKEETIARVESAQCKAEQEEKDEKAAAVSSYLKSGLQLENVRIAWGEHFGETVRGVFGTVVNDGSRTLTDVTVRVYFLDADGKRIGETDFHPVLATDFSSVDDSPLRPGYRKDFGFSFEDEAPSGWSGKVDAEILDIKFADQPAD